MDGWFHMAEVPPGTPWGSVGDPVDAFFVRRPATTGGEGGGEGGGNNGELFRMPVGPFSLISEEEEER